RLSRSSHAPLAALAKRLRAEEQIHVEHADAWLTRLGRAGGEAAARLQAALDRLAPLAPGLFEPTAGVDELESAGIYPRGQIDMFTQWRDELSRVAAQAGLQLNMQSPGHPAPGGRRGVHSAAFAPLLDELCEVYRVEPEASW
ncbi:MAG: Phenylacetic acid catabolic protein, partial [Burkholderiales bacterium]